MQQGTDRAVADAAARGALAGGAGAELLEGEWAKDYLRAEYLPGETDLWPSQRQGSVLVADATGSGKTRSGRHELTVEGLRRAQILCVDEGRNFLNMKSNRTQQLLRNMADHIIGTRVATRDFGLQGFSRDETGNQLHRLREQRGKLPRK